MNQLVNEQSGDFGSLRDGSAPDAPVAVLLALATVRFDSKPATWAENPGFARGSTPVLGRDTVAHAVEWPIRCSGSSWDCALHVGKHTRKMRRANAALHK